MLQTQLLILSIITSSTALKTTQQTRKQQNKTKPLKIKMKKTALLSWEWDHHFEPEIKSHIKHFHKGSEELQRMGQRLIQIVSIASKKEQLRTWLIQEQPQINFSNRQGYTYIPNFHYFT